jgi:DUF1009 family protein
MGQPSQPSAKPLGIIAGGGALVLEAIKAARDHGYAPHIIAIDNEANPADFNDYPLKVLRWGQVGALLKTLTKWQTRDLLFIGGISKRPDLRQLRPDFGAIKLLPKIMTLAKGGDEALFAKVARFFEEHGFDILSPLEIFSHNDFKNRCLTDFSDKEYDDDIVLAMRAAHLCGGLDMGQGAVAINGRVVAMEGPEGTDAMLQRVAQCQKKGRLFKVQKQQGVLVKCARPKQDLRFDVPTIGPLTIENAAEAGLAGIVIEAGKVMIAELEKTFALANKKRLFLVSRSFDEDALL